MSYIPVTKRAADLADSYLRDLEITLAQQLGDKSRKNLDDKIQEERLRHARILNDFNGERLAEAVDILAPELQAKKIKSRSKQLGKKDKAELVSMVAALEIQLQVERKYGELVQHVIEFFTNHINGAELGRIQLNATKQLEKNKKYGENERKIVECITELGKQLGRDLVGTDYPKLKKILIKTYPSPEFIPKPRLSKEEKANLESAAEEISIKKRTGWADSTIRKVFKKVTGCTPTTKIITSPK